MGHAVSRDVRRWRYSLARLARAAAMGSRAFVRSRRGMGGAGGRRASPRRGPPLGPPCSASSNSDGVRGFELGVVWPITEIVQQNVLMRTEPRYVEHNMSFATMLCFGDAGNGDLLGFGRRF